MSYERVNAMERLPDAELEVMQALWRQEKYPVSSAALMEELAGRRWQTATLLKLLSRLEERGFVKREKEGRNNLYTPLVRREDYLSAESRAFLQRLHGGSLPSLVAALMDVLPFDFAILRRMHHFNGRNSRIKWGENYQLIVFG